MQSPYSLYVRTGTLLTGVRFKFFLFMRSLSSYVRIVYRPPHLHTAYVNLYVTVEGTL